MMIRAGYVGRTPWGAPKAEAGDRLVRRSTIGPYLHYGAGIGPDLVVHCDWDHGCHVGTTDEYAKGLPFARERFPVDAPVVFERGMRTAGLPLDPLSWNCEHNANYVLFGVPHSQQVANTVLVVAVALGLWAALKN